MDLSTITVDDFKAQFTRDFPYLPVWQAPPAFYNNGDEVYYPVTRLFYTANKNNVTSVPTTGADWVETPDDVANYVQDSDITRAFGEALVVFNQALFSTDANIKMAFLYVVAHYLCIDLQAAMAGISGGGTIGIMSGRTVGSVSESYTIPEAYLSNPVLAGYTKTNYGQKYLSLILTKLVGNFGVVAGTTLP